MIKKLYPQGKSKAFNITYDDGVLQDIRFVELLNQYGIKGTFNLNSELMRNEFEWIHECGMTVKRLSEQAVLGLYDGHEIASHTLTHPYMYHLNEDEVMYQLGADKENLQRLFGREIFGFSVPFDYYSELIAECAKRCGFEYARYSEEGYRYIPDTDYYWWRTGIFHLSEHLESFVEGFFETEEELALCQIVGHSYDLDAANMWEQMESILQKIAEDEEVLSMTNLEIVRYLKAMEKAMIQEDMIYNDSDMDLWFDVDGEVMVVYAGESLTIKK